MDSMNERLMVKEILVVPPGLRELMSDISREVLRCNPFHIYTFIADYLDSLLITRENAKAAQQIVDHLKEKSELITDVCENLYVNADTGLTVAKIVQKGFKEYVAGASTELPPIKYDMNLIYDKLTQNISLTKRDVDVMAVIIQRAYRSYRSRKIRQAQPQPLDWKTAYDKTDHILKECEVPDEERKRAATLIQAAYRGYYSRKVTRGNKVQEPSTLTDMPSSESLEMLLECDDINLKDYDAVMYEVQNNAASVIQKAYRKHKNNQTGQIDSILQNLSFTAVGAQN